MTEGLHRLFLSKTVCKDLGIIDPTFPSIGRIATHPTINKCSIESPGQDGTEADGQERHAGQSSCQCPTRTLPPPSPSQPPFDATEENIPKLKEWILNKYNASAFNCCENQILPLITNSPPMALHVDTQARPVAAHKTAPVSLHWQREVKEGLDNDVAMGVLKKVEVGEPTTWCLWMVACAKKMEDLGVQLT